ncbi:unnamed protein product [Adineta ricciae]|uniref:G-protein coupled receptors family 1 profile domain-containing protein n=1 Tax=Adineta ricciae TaxID=249248 RepID=A0A815SRZ5_ADIRI|nr:unnamed protein product [Adineta ricciae]CAF1540296.1 unnamed protein product [Adineta ricciae]
MADIFQIVNLHLTKILTPIVIICGIIGNSFNIVVLTRRCLYNHACSRYFLALSINNLYFCTVTTTQQYLSNISLVDLAQTSIHSCRFFVYGNVLCVLLLPYYTVIISIDRYCASSNKVQIRNLSNIKVSRYVITIVTSMFALYALIYPILVTLRQDDGFGCRIRYDMPYKQIFGLLLPITVAIVGPILMTIFGLLTIKNISRNRIIPVENSFYRRTESQLFRMLFFQIGVYVILNTLKGITFIISNFPLSIVSTSQFRLVSSFSDILFKISFSTPFFLLYPIKSNLSKRTWWSYKTIM